MKKWTWSLQWLAVRLILEFWRRRMIRTQNETLRLRYSQRCDLYILRYYSLGQRLTGNIPSMGNFS
ncbi:MAG: hypothetical protein M1596_04365 [Firmicutes bacterium]|nr:hypothetical protein [Bacillota bacterium]